MTPRMVTRIQATLQDVSKGVRHPPGRPMTDKECEDSAAALAKYGIRNRVMTTIRPSGWGIVKING